MFGLGPELHGQAILRSGANTAADVIPADPTDGSPHWPRLQFRLSAPSVCCSVTAAMTPPKETLARTSLRPRAQTTPSTGALRFKKSRFGIEPLACRKCGTYVPAGESS